MAKLNENGNIDLKDALKLIKDDPRLYEISEDKKSLYRITRDGGGKCGDFMAKIDVPQKHMSCVNTIPSVDFKGERKSPITVVLSSLDVQLRKLPFFISDGDAMYEFKDQIYRTDLDVSFLPLEDAILNSYGAGTKILFVPEKGSSEKMLAVGGSILNVLEAVYLANKIGPGKYKFEKEMDEEAYISHTKDMDSLAEEEESIKP